MSNVISMATARRPKAASGLAALLASFAQHRRAETDPFWLKENAEVLGILAAIGQRPDPQALRVYANIYADLPARLSFFPQYYRMLLGLALSLEALGMPGNLSQSMGAWIAREGLVAAETSDVQRAEARYLLQRCGQGIGVAAEGLDARLHHFIDRPATFALPNQKAAYELVHLLFYLSHYGEMRPDLPQGAERALRNAGTIALLEQNSDLLAEVCIARHYAGFAVPEPWKIMVQRQETGLQLSSGSNLNDSYHNFLVNQWLFGTIADASFGHAYPTGPIRFDYNLHKAVPLREMSHALLALGEARSGEWAVMRAICAQNLSHEATDVLVEAEAADPQFEDFFADFARARRI